MTGKESSSYVERGKKINEHLKGTFELSKTSESEDGSVISSEECELKVLSEDGITESEDNKLVIRINEMLKYVEPGQSYNCCIYKVPEMLRKLNEQAYSPRVVSIGPFHYGSIRLSSMEALKKRYFKRFIERTMTRTKKYVKLVKGFEGRARECYAETIVMDSNEFVSMMVIDTCFIIELLLRFHYSPFKREDYKELPLPWLMSDICLDLMLLENQIPFFVLEAVFDQAMASTRGPSLQDLTLGYFNEYNTHGMMNFNLVNHFADLVLIMSRPRRERLPQGLQNFQSLYSATELHEAGVMFQADPSSKCLFNIGLSGDVLTMPCFILHDHTETFIRNLMAVEFCHYPENSYIIDYIVFMAGLINTTRDVDLLVNSNIIINYLDDNKAAAYFFSVICSNISCDGKKFYFSQISKELNEYYKLPMHRLRAMLNRDYIYTLKRDYCHTPWKTTATIGAIMLLVLAIIQTACSIISVVTNK